MKVYYIAVMCKGDNGSVKTLAVAKDLTKFGYFERKSVGEFMDFTAKTLVERTVPGTFSKLEEKGYNINTHLKRDGVGGVVITDLDYPPRVAHSLILKISGEFEAQYPPAAWTGNPSDTPFPPLDGYL
eukprot:UC1_evm1s1492